jgi:hypothetical protein
MNQIVVHISQLPFDGSTLGEGFDEHIAGAASSRDALSVQLRFSGELTGPFWDGRRTFSSIVARPRVAASFSFEMKRVEVRWMWLDGDAEVTLVRILVQRVCPPHS